MNSGVRIPRKRNPRDKANVLSLIFIGYVYKTIRKGVYKDLQEDDIYEVVNSCESKKLGDRLQNEWEKELNKKNPSLLRAIFRIHGFKYACLGVSIFIYETTLATILEPILIGKVTSYFEPGTNITKSDATMYTVGLFGCSMLLCLCNNQFLIGLLTMTLQIRIAVTSLIYRKCTKLNANFSTQYESGKAITLITKDILQFFDSADYALMILVGIPQFCVMMVISYLQIGISAIAGASLIFFVLPINLYLGALTTSCRLKTARKTDERIKISQETFTAIRTIKIYTWESFFAKILAIASSLGELSSRMAFYICVITYTALGNHITAEKAFIVTGCFGALRSVLTTYMPMGVAQMAELKASIERITSYLMLEEVSQNKNCDDCEVQEGKITLQSATAKSNGNVKVLDNINAQISKGLTVVFGPTGSGKSILLKAILGDIPLSSGKIEVQGMVSYASQEPWLFPATVRQNIIFGERYDEQRYKKVVQVCALERDLDMFSNGDQTLVTDRGSNMSRGQKSRINLARAVYKKAHIYLLDDCLSSVDSRVGKQIFQQCVTGFLKNFVCVLVTHDPFMLQENDVLINLAAGCLQFNDNFCNFCKWQKNNLAFRGIKLTENENSTTSIETSYVNNVILNKPIETNDSQNYKESNEVGKVNRAIYYAYYASGGGYKMVSTVLLVFLVSQVSTSCSDYFVGFWVDMEQELSSVYLNHTTNWKEYNKLENVRNNVITYYSFVMLGASIFTVLRAVVFYIFSSKASSKIHNTMMEKILNTKITFFDTNLIGNVLNRFSRDLGIIDEHMPRTLFEVINVILSVLGVFFVVSSVNIYFIIPSLLFIAILYYFRRLYVPTGRSLRRLEGAVRSPMIGHMSATLEGLTTIRANGAQTILQNEFDKHQDHYNSVVYMNIVTSRAFGFYTDMTCAFYIAVITFSFLFFNNDTLAGQVGLAITQSFGLTRLLQNGIRQWAELENQMTSTERALEYANLDVEVESGEQPENWPKTGSVEYRHVSLQYSGEPEPVLRDLRFHIEDKQKVGIVGRTGAGKTSLILTLLQMFEYKGSILIDGVDIKSVALKYLRSKISFIPQDPILFSGTVRTNLDPYCQYADDIIWAALDEVKMKHCFNTLNSPITEGGIEFSVGERQLLCLARAVVQNNNILVLDEATANIDPLTETLIQAIIKKRFSNCTVITIAHKLHIVMRSDLIIVMDGGRIIQFGPPEILLKDRYNIFHNMVKASGLDC